MAIEGEVAALVVEDAIRGVKLADGRELQAPTVVMTTGTELSGPMPSCCRAPEMLMPVVSAMGSENSTLMAARSAAPRRFRRSPAAARPRPT